MPVIEFESWLAALNLETLPEGTNSRDAIRALIDSRAQGVVVKGEVIEFVGNNVDAFQNINGRLCYTTNLPHDCDVATNFVVSGGEGVECKLLIGGTECDPLGVHVVFVSALFAAKKVRFYLTQPVPSFSIRYDTIFLDTAPREQLATSDVRTSTHFYHNGLVTCNE